MGNVPGETCPGSDSDLADPEMQAERNALHRVIPNDTLKTLLEPHPCRQGIAGPEMGV